MKEAYWGYGIILLGLFVIAVMMLLSNITTSSTQDYYLVKETSEAAMIDAIDYGYYRLYGELRINRERFVESFLRRFAENAVATTYEINFYDIYEAPPKVSVEVISNTGKYSVIGDASGFDIVNRIDAIIETTGTSSEVTE